MVAIRPVIWRFVPIVTRLAGCVGLLAKSQIYSFSLSRWTDLRTGVTGVAPTCRNYGDVPDAVPRWIVNRRNHVFKVGVEFLSADRRMP